jgi:hypothetical protein
MQLKDLNNATGTGVNANTTAEQWSPTPFYNYVILILKLLMGFILFCYVTTSNYLNSLAKTEDTDYPVGDSLLKELSEKKNPYCSNLVDYVYVNNISDRSERAKIISFAWWFQKTQQSSYEIGGRILNKFFKVSRMVIGKGNGSANEIPHTGILPFIRWLIFGIFTKLSLALMLMLVFAIWIPGWFGGLTAFSPLPQFIEGFGLKIVCIFWLFIGSIILMCVLGWVSVFPVIYEFVHIIYLFFIKQLSSDSSKVSNEFMSRMKYLIVVYVIVTLSIAAVQLPPPTTGAMIVGAIILYYLIHKIGKTK